MNKRIHSMIGFLISLCLLLSTALPAHAETADLTISTVEEFLTFAENCRLDSYSRDLTVSLEADIDLSAVDFEGIPIFSGSFMGNGHTVSGLQIKGEGSQQGLFRYLTATALVKDLNAEGEVAPQGSRSSVGGIAGSNAGRLENCSFTGSVTGGEAVGGLVGVNTVTGIVENCRTEGTVSGIHCAGGIAGNNQGVIRVCANLSQVNITAQENSVDISDITMDTLTNSESAATVTDIGGIAGTSSGVIRSCENRGNVGYRQMGYNVGGIAGSQSGYIADCENYAQIYGRKEVGGIVGQMEPVTSVDFSEDTLQTLQTQLDTLSVMADRTTAGAQNSASQLSGQMAVLESQLQSAMDAVEQLLPKEDEETPELPDEDSILAAQNALSSAMSGMSNTMGSIATSTQNAASSLSGNVQAMTNQMGAIGDTLGSASEGLGGSFTDVSDLDTEADIAGKVAQSRNHGAVHADINAGGIAGAMSLENDLDPEDDLQLSGELSLNFEGKLRCVVLGCENTGSVTALKQNAGGIVGRQPMGLVKDCQNSGPVEAESADYVGGIAGQSSGFIRTSSAKCSLSGDMYVGGIAGNGGVVTDCRSLVQISGSERTGAVLGLIGQSTTETEDPIRGNYYLVVGADHGGIDGISYEAAAQPLEKADFLALEGLPKMFETVTVRFLQEDGTQKLLSLEPGGSLDAADIPDVQEKDGYVGHWEGLADAELTNILFDMTFMAGYKAHNPVISGEDTRPDGRPILLVQGDFPVGTQVSAELLTREGAIEGWSFALTQNQSAKQLRYLLPDGCSAEDVLLMLRRNEAWEEAEFTANGSYLVFQVDGEVDGFCIAQAPADYTQWIILAAGAVAVLATLTVSLCCRRNKRKTVDAGDHTGPQ